jgi:PAS domain S-box-containing protein
MFGPLEEWGGRRWADWAVNLLEVEPEQWSDLKKSRVREGGSEMSPVWFTRVQTREGTTFYGELHWIFPEEEFVIAQIRDISERHFFEQAIRQNEARFQALSSSALEGIALIESEWIVDCNDKFAEIMGYDHPNKLMKRKAEPFFDARTWKRITARPHHGNRVEAEVLQPNGNRVHLEATLNRSQQDESLQVLLVYDITERKRTELDLLRTKERFRLLVETSPIGLFLVSEGQIKYANAMAADLLGVSSEEDLFDTPLVVYFQKEDHKTLEEALHETRQGKKIAYQEYRAELPDGKVREVGVRMTLSFFDRNPAVQVTMTDLTTRAQLYREQLRATVAEEANEKLLEEIERHRATQRRLNEAERLNRSIVESSIDMIVAFDVQGNLMQWNQAASVEFGWTFEEARQLTFRGFLADEADAERIFQELQSQNYFAGEVQGIRSTGETFTLLMSVAVLRDLEGVSLGAVVVGRDITDIKLAQLELRESEERYRDILEHATDLIFLVNADGYFTYANPAFFRTLGFQEEDLESIPIQQVITDLPEDGDALWMDALEGSRRDWTFRDSSGNPVWMIGSASAQFDEEGDRVGLRGIFLDVTDMRRHERAARMQSARLQSLFNSTRNLLIFTLDRERKITSLNDNFRDELLSTFGIEAELGMEVIPAILERVDTTQHSGPNNYLERVFEGKPQQFELAFRDLEDDLIWVQVFINPVQDAVDVGQEEVSVIVYDITDRKEADHQIRKALKEKEVLLQEVHHRVKNNLQVISSMLSLQRRFVPDPSLAQVLEDSINRISTMSYIHESLYKNTDFSSIRFSEYLKRLSSNLLHSYAPKDCDLTFDPQLEEIHLNIEQAIPCGLLVNELVSNAMKHAFQGRKEGNLMLRVSEKEGVVEIEVRDDGVGLQVDWASTKNDSLGMYLVQALSEQLNAQLTIRSATLEAPHHQEKGSSFLISFVPKR